MLMAPLSDKGFIRYAVIVFGILAILAGGYLVVRHFNASSSTYESAAPTVGSSEIAYLTCTINSVNPAIPVAGQPFAVTMTIVNFNSKATANNLESVLSVQTRISTSPVHNVVFGALTPGQTANITNTYPVAASIAGVPVVAITHQATYSYNGRSQIAVPGCSRSWSL